MKTLVSMGLSAVVLMSFGCSSEVSLAERCQNAAIANCDGDKGTPKYASCLADFNEKCNAGDLTTGEDKKDSDAGTTDKDSGTPTPDTGSTPDTGGPVVSKNCTLSADGAIEGCLPLCAISTGNAINACQDSDCLIAALDADTTPPGQYMGQSVNCRACFLNNQFVCAARQCPAEAQALAMCQQGGAGADCSAENEAINACIQMDTAQFQACSFGDAANPGIVAQCFG